MRNFKELKIWQKGFQIALNTFKISNSFNETERRSLGLQMNKCGISIPSNIAEGSSRSSRKDYNRFIEISLGSTFELETQMLLAQATKIGNDQLISETLCLITEEEKMLTAFSKTLIS